MPKFKNISEHILQAQNQNETKKVRLFINQKLTKAFTLRLSEWSSLSFRLCLDDAGMKQSLCDR